MFETTRWMRDPARKRVLALGFLLIAAVSTAARADDGIVDVRTLPRLEGAEENTARTEFYRLQYGVPTVVAVTSAATRKMLADAGWVPYVEPLEETSTSLKFKKGQQGLDVSFSQALGRPDRSVVYYSADRINADVPFPPEASDVVFDGNRPYLGCVVTATVDATLEFFRKELPGAGWSPLTAAEASARWPAADLDEATKDGVRAYFKNERDSRRPPIVLLLQRREDGKTGVEVKVAPFAMPQDLEAGDELAGLPTPKRTKSSRGAGGPSSNRRELNAAVVAEVPTVLAFYRRELAARNWKEEPGAADTSGQVTLKFSSPEETAVLKLSHKYDLTIVSLATQLSEAALAARARAKKEADEKFARDAEAAAKEVMARDEARRKAQAANLSDAPVHAATDTTTPVPIPDNAEDVTYDGAAGKLEFNTSSSVKAIAAFYRGSLRSMGWKEQPSVINKPTMVDMEFSRGGKELSFTAMQMGAKVNVSADGSGLVMALAKPRVANARPPAVSDAKQTETLEADPDSALPLPKQHTMSSLGAGGLPGGGSPFRSDLDASVPAGLDAVLAFYRTQLGKRGWQEKTEGAIVTADRVQLAFSSPEGPAVLKLGRDNGGTSINLVQKNPDAAAKADILPKSGRARVMLGNIGDGDASMTINKQTFKIAAGTGGPQSPKGPTLDLPPGKYQYSVKIAGRPAQSNTIEIAAGDTWGLMIGPAGEVMPLQLY